MIEDAPDFDAASTDATSAVHEESGWGAALFEAIDDAVFVHDADGHILEVNSAACRRLGYSRAEMLRLNTRDIDDPSFASGFADRLQSQLGQGQFRCEGRHRTKDGRVIPVDINTSAIKLGEKNAILAVMRDITLQKQASEVLAASERHYRQLTEATIDAIILADEETIIRLFNPAAERLFGYRAEEVIGQRTSMLVPLGLRSRHEEGFARYVKTREAHLIGRTVEVTALHKDGSEIPVEIALSVLSSSTPLDGGGRGEVQILAAFRDLTERNKMRSVVIQNEKLASIGLLSAGMAHEINNPLAFVANNLAVLERDTRGLLSLIDLYSQGRGALDAALSGQIASHEEEIDLPYLRDNLARMLDRTRDGVGRVSRIVHSLRGFARTDPPRLQDVHLPDIIDNALEILRGRFKRTGIVVEQEHDPSPRVACVETQISQVMLNLLVNAFQALEAQRREGGLIRVRTKRQGREMIIEIADNGPGIAAEHRAMLFNPFFTTKEVGEGTGLGLAISHTIVEAHGGHIEVESQPGHGATFRVCLPIKKRQE